MPPVLARRAAKAAALPLGVVTRRRRGDVVILLFHKVGAGDREIDVPVDLFERNLAALAERERVLSLDAAMAQPGGGGVVLSFDDGFRDFHEHVVPALVRHGLPAVLYLATGLVANGTTPVRDALTWPQLRDALETGLVTVGAHTHDHTNLARAREREAEEAMRRSQELVEDHLGRACRHFAYPWGVGSPAADRVARRLFDTAALGAWRTNRRGRTDPHRLGRTPVFRGDGPAFFRAKARGLLDGEGLVYRALRRGPWGDG